MPVAVLLCLLHVKHRNQYPRRDHQRRAQKGEGVHGLSEHEDPHEYPGDGLEGAENGGSAPPDEKGAPLEKSHRSRVHDAGKAQRQEPSEESLGECQLSREQADQEQKDGRDA